MTNELTEGRHTLYGHCVFANYNVDSEIALIDDKKYTIGWYSINDYDSYVSITESKDNDFPMHIYKEPIEIDVKYDAIDSLDINGEKYDIEMVTITNAKTGKTIWKVANDWTFKSHPYGTVEFNIDSI